MELENAIIFIEEYAFENVIWKIFQLKTCGSSVISFSSDNHYYPHLKVLHGNPQRSQLFFSQGRLLLQPMENWKIKIRGFLPICSSTVLKIPTGLPVWGRLLWRRTGNFLLIFLQVYVYNFFIEFQTLFFHMFTIYMTTVRNKEICKN